MELLESRADRPHGCEVKETWLTEEEIRNHAYAIYVARRDDEPGSDLKDWLAAEAQLRRRVKVP